MSEPSLWQRLRPARRRDRTADGFVAEDQPALILDYAASGLWERPGPAGWHPPARLHNAGTREARSISISDLTLDAEGTCRFPAPSRLPPGARFDIEWVRHRGAAGGRGPMPRRMLTALLSRAAVRQVLGGVRSIMPWTLQVRYEDARGRRYVSVCRIDAVSLPLALAAGTVVMEAE
jgi:hypothetical protein